MDFSSVTEYDVTGENNLNFALAHQTTFISNNISDGGRHCTGSIVSLGGSTVNGHGAGHIGTIVSEPKTTVQGALLMQSGSINKTDYPLLTTWAYDNGFVKSTAQFSADPTLRTFFVEHATDSNILYLPDWRGVSERGLDTSGSFDPDGAARTLMDYQDYATAAPRNRTGSRVDSDGNTLGSLQASQAGFARVTCPGENATSAGSDSDGSGLHLDLGCVVLGDQETRSRNVAVNYFIYYN